MKTQFTKSAAIMMALAGVMTFASCDKDGNEPNVPKEKSNLVFGVNMKNGIAAAKKKASLKSSMTGDDLNLITGATQKTVSNVAIFPLASDGTQAADKVIVLGDVTDPIAKATEITEDEVYGFRVYGNVETAFTEDSQMADLTFALTEIKADETSTDAEEKFAGKFMTYADAHQQTALYNAPNLYYYKEVSTTDNAGKNDLKSGTGATWATVNDWTAITGGGAIDPAVYQFIKIDNVTHAVGSLTANLYAMADAAGTFTNGSTVTTDWNNFANKGDIQLVGLLIGKQYQTWGDNFDFTYTNDNNLVMTFAKAEGSINADKVEFTETDDPNNAAEKFVTVDNANIYTTVTPYLNDANDATVPVIFVLYLDDDSQYEIQLNNGKVVKAGNYFYFKGQVQKDQQANSGTYNIFEAHRTTLVNAKIADWGNADVDLSNMNIGVEIETSWYKGAEFDIEF